jgi:hypothetical protein
MTPQLVADFEAEVLPCLEDYAQQLRKRFPRFSAKVGSASLGGADVHLVFLDCWREKSEGKEPNCVSLEIGIRIRDGETILCALDVCWGGDGTPPRDALDCLDEAVPWRQAALEKIKNNLPKLMCDLEECLKAWEATYLK